MPIDAQKLIRDHVRSVTDSWTTDPIEDRRLARTGRLPLTKRQAEIYGYIKTQIKENGYAPSLAEIGARFHLRSVATVHKHVENLRRKGVIEREWNCMRSMMLTARCPTCGK